MFRIHWGETLRDSGVQPTGVERTFGEDELIVSKTDPRGRITYANETFCTIARYREEQVIGQPHNIVRHPDMPRVIFKQLWETIAGGHEIFAYVVNLAADGAHYWVLAHVTPSFDTQGRIVGYHSNRRLPARSAVETIEPWYATLRQAETRLKGDAQLAASSELMERMLADRGLTYDEFVWSITPAEVAR